MVHIRGHLDNQEWEWLKTLLNTEKYLGDERSCRILDKIKTNEVDNGKLGTARFIQNGRI